MSKSKRYLALLPAVFVMGALLVPGAQADGVKNQDQIPWHEPIPNIPIPDEVKNPITNRGIKAECGVAGTIDLVGSKKGHGVGTKPAHGFYQFSEVQIICVGNGLGNLHYTGTFAVAAQGATDGLAEELVVVDDPADPADPAEIGHDLEKLLAGDLEGLSGKPKGAPDDKKKIHGEDLTQGWSHGANYCGVPGPVAGNVNKGDIAVTKLVGDPVGQQAKPCKTLAGQPGNPGSGAPGDASWVKFVRGWNQTQDMNLRADGERVVAWGLLQWRDSKKPEDGNKDCFRADLLLEPIDVAEKDDETVISVAALEGTAVIYNLGGAVNAKDGAPIAADGCDTPETSFFTKSSSSTSGNGGGGSNSRGPNK